VVADMAHMDAPRGIREHLEHVVFRSGLVFARNEAVSFRPRLLPAGLRLARIIAFDIGVRIHEKHWQYQHLPSLASRVHIPPIMTTGHPGLTSVRQWIAAAAARAGRAADEITLVAVSKTFGAEAIEPVIVAGQTAFGENRVQE